MAIAFARVSIHTRSKGHSAVAASAYRTASLLRDERTGELHDYSKRSDVIYSDILLPDETDSAFNQREFLWNQAELAEKRSDAQLCKDVVLALPKELNLGQQIELAKQFAQTHFVANGLPVDLAIHDDEGNPHAHLLVPTRRLEAHGFSKHKARDLNPVFAKGRIVEHDYWGKLWRDAQNDFFVERGIDLTVDLNHLIAERHQGRIEGKDDHYLAQDNKLIQAARKELVANSPEQIIQHLFSQHSVFSRRDVEKLLFKTFKQHEKTEVYLNAVETILGHAEVIELGLNPKGEICYTTRQQYILEAQLRHDIETMMQRKIALREKNMEALTTRYTLDEEQKEAFQYITDSPSIRVVIGRPGTGKSYLLKPVNDYYKKQHYEVIGCSLSGKVAKSLQTDTGIKSSTIASLVYRMTHQQLKLTKKHVLIVDEAGMVDVHNMGFIIGAARKAGSKLILLGDPDQLKPIHKGEVFRGIAAITGYVELEAIKRQRSLGDREASLDLSKGHIEKAVKHYQNNNAIIFSDSPITTKEILINDWQKSITPDNLKHSILLAFTRAAVNKLNEKARHALQEKKIIGQEEIAFRPSENALKISTGERLLFKKNDKTLGLRNGDLGTVKTISNSKMSVQLDSGELINVPNTYHAMDYGYALTVHKSQGMTTENVSVLIDSKYWDRHLSFVAMTRHKNELKIYADRENHPTINALKNTLSRSITKDNVIDWPLDFGLRSGFEPDSLISKAINHLGEIGHRVKNGFNYLVHYESYLLTHKKTASFKNKELFRNAAKNEALWVEKRAELKSISPEKINYEQLKKEYPILAKYDLALEQRKKLTGYWGEKANKEIIQLAKKIIAQKGLTEKINQHLPMLMKTLQQLSLGEQSRVRC